MLNDAPRRASRPNRLMPGLHTRYVRSASDADARAAVLSVTMRSSVVASLSPARHRDGNPPPCAARSFARAANRVVSPDAFSEGGLSLGSRTSDMESGTGRDFSPRRSPRPVAGRRRVGRVPDFASTSRRRGVVAWRRRVCVGASGSRRRERDARATRARRERDANRREPTTVRAAAIERRSARRARDARAAVCV